MRIHQKNEATSSHSSSGVAKCSSTSSLPSVASAAQQLLSIAQDEQLSPKEFFLPDSQQDYDDYCADDAPTPPDRPQPSNDRKVLLPHTPRIQSSLKEAVAKTQSLLTETALFSFDELDETDLSAQLQRPSYRFICMLADRINQQSKGGFNLTFKLSSRADPPLDFHGRRAYLRKLIDTVHHISIHNIVFTLFFNG